MNYKEERQPRAQPQRKLCGRFHNTPERTNYCFAFPLAVLSQATVARIFSSSATGAGAAVSAGGAGTVKGMDDKTLIAGWDAGFNLLLRALTRVIFRFGDEFLRGGSSPAASRNSAKLTSKNSSRRRRS